LSLISVFEICNIFFGQLSVQSEQPLQSCLLNSTIVLPLKRIFYRRRRFGVKKPAKRWQGTLKTGYRNRQPKWVQDRKSRLERFCVEHTEKYFR
jgi:hypothetical protein